MARADDTELIDAFEEFYRSYYRNEIGELAQKYPTEQKSLYVDWDDLYRFDPPLADDFRSKPDQLRQYAEEALRLYDLPVDVSLGQAHVRVRSLPERTEIRAIRADHRGMLIAIQGIVRKATDVRPKITTAAFECQRCGTLTRIPQEGGDFQEPHECQGCERQGPFHINYDQSEFIDAQKLRVQESPEGLRGGETPQSVDVNIEDDITGQVTAGDHVEVTGILKLDQQGSEREKSPMFDFYMDGMTVEIEDEQFEEMDITDDDKKEIIELSNEPDIYGRMERSIAPSIYGYEKEKRAMIFQLFSGVTKHLPDGSRTRGDLHMLLIGDPGTGKSQLLQYVREIAPRSVYTSGKGSSAAGLCVTGDTIIHTEDGLKQIRTLVEEELQEPVTTETGVPRSHRVYTYDRNVNELGVKETSHIWRMPEKPCRRIETSYGKKLEASVNTPVLVCGEKGIEWKRIGDVTEGEYVATPNYLEKVNDSQRSPVEVRKLLELTTEKVKLTEDSIAFLRERLSAEFGTLRDAAASLSLSEDFVYDTLSNRHVPLEKLDRVLDGVEVSREDLEFERMMIRHGDSISLPEVFDEDLMYLLGLAFGDGDIRLDRRDGNRGCIRISNGNEAVLERAIDIVNEKFDKKVTIEHQEDRVPCIRIHSATIARLFANAGMQTPKQELRLNPKLTTAKHTSDFLRGYMDADGSVSSRDTGGSSVLCSTISKEFARQLQLMLETYGIRAHVRERDRRGEYELEDGYVISSKHVQHFVEIYGADVDRYAEKIGFHVTKKEETLQKLVDETERRDVRIPVGSALATAGASSSKYRNNLVRGSDPGRKRAQEILETVELGATESIVSEAVDAPLLWDEVVKAQETGKKEVFDLTVPDTHNFVGNGIVTHNTAAAVRDDFADGQQWTLEAGALVLADQGIAAVDELDKMRCVTGETLVRTANGPRPIADIAEEAAQDGEVEELDNGRTIRGVDLTVWTMTDDDTLVLRPVAAVHEYRPPDTLSEVTLESGDSVVSTPDHPFFVHTDGERVEKPAADLEVGEPVYIPESKPPAVSDGGVSVAASGVVSGADAGNGRGEVTWSEVKTVESVSSDEQTGGHSKVYDLTVEGTQNFVANNIIIHNSEDQSAMHEALEQQSISVSKAGINATLKSRCSLLGAANPTYGRFDPYESIGEQIDLDPPLISRFDLIFTVTDQPDEEKDAELADHILKTNYAGELHTHRTEMNNSDYTAEEVERVTDDVAPEIDPELLRKYIAYAKRNCYPTMTEEAKSEIQEFYVQLRSRGADEDAPVPVTARKLEALVRLAEASARVRLSDTVETEDARRATDIARYCLEEIGMDPETGEFDADVIETGTSKSQRDRIKSIKHLIAAIEEEYDEGAPVDVIVERAEEEGIETGKAEHEIDKLKQKGEVYEPQGGYLRTT